MRGFFRSTLAWFGLAAATMGCSSSPEPIPPDDPSLSYVTLSVPKMN